MVSMHVSVDVFCTRVSICVFVMDVLKLFDNV